MLRKPVISPNQYMGFHIMNPTTPNSHLATFFSLNILHTFHSHFKRQYFHYDTSNDSVYPKNNAERDFPNTVGFTNTFPNAILNKEQT